MIDKFVNLDEATTRRTHYEKTRSQSKRLKLKQQ